MNSLRSLKKYFLRYKKKLALGMVFIIISNLAQVYIPLLLRDSIDGIRNNINQDILLKYGLLIIGSALLSGVFRFLIRQTIIVVSREIEFDIRFDFWQHLQKLPLKFYQNNTTGNLMAHATNDISAVRMFVGPAVMYSIDTVTKFVFIITIMLSLSPLLSLYAFIPLPILSYLVYKLSKRIHKKFTLIQEKFSDLTTKAQENFSGIRVVKSYVREEGEIESFNKLSREYLDRNMDKVRIQAFFQPLLYLISGTSIIVVIWAGGSMVIDGTLTLGDISAFMIYLGLLIWPMIAFGWILNIIQQASASMKRILRILGEEIFIKDTARTKRTINDIKGDVEFKNVSYKFDEDGPYVLKDINIKIPKGSTAAIIGHTGSGKTTLLNLIPRLYDVDEGEVTIDGHNVRDIPLKVLRKNIGLVPQETFLFSDTLENNILYGAGGKKEWIEKAAEISRLSNDVENFNNGYKTILGERGITLSGGQKQRTSLARAIAVDPNIMLLDDSFSAVDTNTEEQILSNLKEFMKGRTSIIVSHRISTVKNADKIYVLEDGRVAEEGTHDELVEKDGLYADLHYKQLLEEELKELN